MINKNSYEPVIYNGDCTEIIQNKIPLNNDLVLSFLDPPFNQNKNYEGHNDDMEPDDYWNWMKKISILIYERTKPGGTIYFMQREKNTEQVLKILKESGWKFQNLIIWKKKTSPVPQLHRYSKQFQIIVFASKGSNPIPFHKLRIDCPLPPKMKIPREDSLIVTDVWDDIRELTSGFLAGHEPLRNIDNKRSHEQQAPIALLLRIILSSTNIGDIILDPFAGTGTTNIVAQQLERQSIGIENDEKNYELILKRLKMQRVFDNIQKYYEYYRYTENLESIWHKKTKSPKKGLNFYIMNKEKNMLNSH